MSYRTVDPQHVELALQRVDGVTFEKFSQSFFGAIQGTSYVPLGGMHDGGAEGFELASVFEDERPNRFMQASVRKDTRNKIRGTVRRLREFGRSPQQLVYLASAVVPQIDQEEELLSEEFGIAIKIRDAKYISVHINDSAKTIQAYESYLSGLLNYLGHPGAASFIGNSPNLPARALCVFLGQEVERRRGNTQLLESVTDALILWALEGTDPDRGILYDRRQILSAVEAALPSAAHFIRGVLDTRLEKLASKDGTGNRTIRWYRKEDVFCLPYETRQIVREENSEDELLKLQVQDVFRSRATDFMQPDDSEEVIEETLAACQRTLELAFENQGLEVAYFVSGTEPEDHIVPAISDHLDTALEELLISGNRAVRVAEIALKILRATFYDSSEPERVYLGKMSRTYIMMFMLKNDVKIVEYFRSMSGEFNLYIGTDIIIRALSEYFLRPDDQMTFNTLNILKAAGATMVLTEKCVEEVWTHIKATDAEFLNHYADMEPYIDLEIARCIDRILIRSYFYARIDPIDGSRKPAGWRSYLENFLTYSSLRNERGREDLKNYLVAKFGLVYESKEEMLEGIDVAELEETTTKILNERWRQKNAPEKERILAENDALQILRIYQRRKQLGERNQSNPYGFRTWWLTQASSIRRATGDKVAKYKGLYMMRPDFLLHFIALSPSEASVRKSYETVFPTLLGIRLSSRLRPEDFKKAMDEIAEAYAVDEARASVRLAELSNTLKGDFLKRYNT
jgi:hypothetical protein